MRGDIEDEREEMERLRVEERGMGEGGESRDKRKSGRRGEVETESERRQKSVGRAE